LSFDLATEVREETMRYFGYRGTHVEDHMRSYASRGNEWAKFATKAIFFPLVVIGPLPTMVNTHQENAAMMAGAMFFRNVMAFFTIVSAVLLMKRHQWRNHVFLLAVLFSWLFVLGSSGFALQDRFHLVLLPIIVIFAGNIISNADKKMMNYFSVYLMFIGALIVAWNWFKLAGRGLV
jgi:hypothetical protein